MAFNSLLVALRDKPRLLAAVAVLVRLLVILGCSLLAWGAYQQVQVGLGSQSVVLGYSTALLPLPALLCSVAIGLMALRELIRNQALDLGPGAELE
jgi:TRAP-type C4-dicarboxylate transport system permease small subunit